MKKIAIAAALCASASLLPVTAAAQTPEPWKWQGAISLYLPTVSGKTVFSQPAPGNDISVNTDDILGVKGFFMGTLEANNGRWGGFTDVVYVKADETPWPLPGNDDSFDAFVDVNYAGADRTACGSWTLTIDSEAAIPDGADILDCD